MENISHLSGDNAQDVAYTYKIFYVFRRNHVKNIFIFQISELELCFLPLLKFVTHWTCKNCFDWYLFKKSYFMQYLKVFSFNVVMLDIQWTSVRIYSYLQKVGGYNSAMMVTGFHIFRKQNSFWLFLYFNFSFVLFLERKPFTISYT